MILPFVILAALLRLLPPWADMEGRTALAGTGGIIGGRPSHGS
jgi:hypothetical protein